MITWNEILHRSAGNNLEPNKRVEKGLVQWKEQLTKEEFQITRLKGTEMPNSSDVCRSFDSGKYACVCCDSMLFDSSLKYDSGTGWPSFSEPITDNAIKYESDDSLAGRPRIEVMCNVCDAHLGHVFPDGPPPSGIRFCINSVSMKLATN